MEDSHSYGADTGSYDVWKYPCFPSVLIQLRLKSTSNRLFSQTKTASLAGFQNSGQSQKGFRCALRYVLLHAEKWLYKAWHRAVLPVDRARDGERRAKPFINQKCCVKKKCDLMHRMFSLDAQKHHKEQPLPLWEHLNWPRKLRVH